LVDEYDAAVLAMVAEAGKEPEPAGEAVNG